MDFKIGKILRSLDFGEYAEELEGKEFQIWVNPPRELISTFVEIQDEIALLKERLDEIVERSKKDGIGADLTGDVAALDEKILAANERLYTWFAEVWGQGENEETAESVKGFAVLHSDTDPAFWQFVTGRSLEMIRDHREGNRKN